MWQRARHERPNNCPERELLACLACTRVHGRTQANMKISKYQHVLIVPAPDVPQLDEAQRRSVTLLTRLMTMIWDSSLFVISVSTNEKSTVVKSYQQPITKPQSVCLLRRSQLPFPRSFLRGFTANWQSSAWIRDMHQQICCTESGAPGTVWVSMKSTGSFKETKNRWHLFWFRQLLHDCTFCGQMRQRFLVGHKGDGSSFQTWRRETWVKAVT